jgi:NADPH:quinone reductase-like Zn-dependent oxidoreductase
VTAIGSNVDWLAPGDKVMCTTGGCIGTFLLFYFIVVSIINYYICILLANFVAVDHRKCFKVPDNISMPQASSLLSVYGTAYYALIHMARLSRGMSCLVHSGMGGVVIYLYVCI